MVKQYWISVGKRVVDLCLSVKVLTIAALLIISTFALFRGFMDGVTWATLNGGLITAVIAVREGFKVVRIRTLENGNVTPEEKTKILEETKV